MGGIVVKSLDKFKPLYHLPPDINMVICIGGRGGAKTYEVSKFVAFSSTVRKKRCVVLRDEKSTIKESILNEVLLRFDTANKHGFLTPFYERLDIGIKDRETNEMAVFTKGFRASNTEKTANLKSISNIDIAVVEELEDIRDKTKFDKFADSIRKEGSLICVILNTPDMNHWLLQRYFDLVPITLDDVPAYTKVTERQIDGYFKIVPKPIPGLMVIQVGFEDNPHLTKTIVEKYRGYGDPDHHMYDLHHYLTDILGFSSTGRKGQILKKVKPISLADYLAIDAPEYYGQDWGTASPAGFVGVKIVKNRCYCRELSYIPNDVRSIMKMYCALNIHPTKDIIIGDSAETETCDRVRSGYKPDELKKDEIEQYPQLLRGFNLIKARKGPGSIKAGITLMTGLELYAVRESKNLWKEVYNYIYAVDKNENPTDDPQDDNNHLIDPWRYVIQYHKGNERDKKSGYSREN